MKKSASLRIAAALRQEILDGTRKPGERILQELLAEEFGASRLPVREALRMLESDGLVTLVANTGAWVTAMDLAECTETYLIRERLDSLLLSRAVAKYTEADIAHLQRLLQAIEDATDVTGYLAADREFHLESYKPAHMDNLYSMVKRMWDTTEHYRRAYSQIIGWEGLQITHSEHKLLFEAFKHRDAEDAERLMFSHLRRTRLELARHPEVFEPPAS
ncbi:GntR family transcriptional regulator [Paeniglutamicibacter sp. MACA_103]|uniref:GntR family transcriptional regulator n=1 Tax=Paeniglutamicibacter sp. MACA_103 TaxID=3377337 RepID=UPI0038951711